MKNYCLLLTLTLCQDQDMCYGCNLQLAQIANKKHELESLKKGCHRNEDLQCVSSLMAWEENYILICNENESQCYFEVLFNYHWLR